MMVCTAIYMYIHDICRYLYPINWQHQGLLTYFCQAIHTIHMSCSHKRPLVLDFFVTPHGPSGVVLMQSLGNRETWWRIAKFTWQIYRKILTMHWNFGYCTPPRPICQTLPFRLWKEQSHFFSICIECIDWAWPNSYIDWLVVSTLWKIWVRQLGFLFPTEWKVIKIPWFETTNQPVEFIAWW